MLSAFLRSPCCWALQPGGTPGLHAAWPQADPTLPHRYPVNLRCELGPPEARALPGCNRAGGWQPLVILGTELFISLHSCSVHPCLCHDSGAQPGPFFFTQKEVILKPMVVPTWLVSKFTEGQN